MLAKQVRLILPLLLALSLCGTASAQQAGRIESMELLAPNVGWAATKSHLFWTADGGAQWKDITPKLNHNRQMVSSVFFLDASTGWVLLSCGDDRGLAEDDLAASNLPPPRTRAKLGRYSAKGSRSRSLINNSRTDTAFQAEPGWILLILNTGGRYWT